MLHVIHKVFHLVGEQFDTIESRSTCNSVQDTFHRQVIEDVADDDGDGWFRPVVVFNRSRMVVNRQYELRHLLDRREGQGAEHYIHQEPISGCFRKHCGMP